MQDTPSRLEQVRALIKKIDVPVRQVMIEARIVEASDTFSRNLGARLGLHDRSDGQSILNSTNRVTVGGNLNDTASTPARSQRPCRP